MSASVRNTRVGNSAQVLRPDQSRKSLPEAIRMLCHDSVKLCTFPTFTRPSVVGDSMATVDARRTAKTSECPPKQRPRVASVGPYQCGLGQKLMLIAGPC